MYTCFLSMKNLKSWIRSNHLRSKLRINSTNKLKMLNMTMEVNTMVKTAFEEESISIPELIHIDDPTPIQYEIIVHE